jgi:hypothetical protein
LPPSFVLNDSPDEGKIDSKVLSPTAQQCVSVTHDTPSKTSAPLGST